ncbi:MAG: hypothetical protein ACFFCI_10035 [Promethearchaeota archaeon]
MKYSVKFKSHLENFDACQKNPKLFRMETGLYELGSLNKVKNHPRDSNIKINHSPKINIIDINMNIKICHRKKREGD